MSRMFNTSYLSRSKYKLQLDSASAAYVGVIGMCNTVKEEASDGSKQTPYAGDEAPPVEPQPTKKRGRLWTQVSDLSYFIGGCYV